MGWASEYINKLRNGETIKFRPRGNSMQGRIESGQLVTVSPTIPECDGCIAHHAPPEVGDVVLCEVDGSQWLHLVTAIGSDGRYQISNNKGHINGWCTRNNVFGIVVKVEE
jgi:hypothetical protein